MILQGQVGPQAVTTSMSAGLAATLRLGNMGDLIKSDLSPKYYELNYRRALFNGAVVGQTTSAALATTYTGLCLSNPIGSTVNLVIVKVGFSFSVAFAAASAIGLMTGYNSATNVTHTAAVTPRSQFFGVGASGTGLLGSSSTLPTAPTVNTILGVGLTGAITTAPYILNTMAEIEGSIILPPGAYCAFYTSTASGASGGNFSFTWAEIPA